MFRGLCAIIEAYLIYWAVVYFIARKYFKFSREWAAPLASGISICGVSAAIATGGAIRARPIVPIMVSSLVVIFAVVELLILPFLAQWFLWAGAHGGRGLDGVGGQDRRGRGGLRRHRGLPDPGQGPGANQGVKYKEGWILMTATTVKVFIDIFIGVWAFILAVIWCSKIECTGGRIKAGGNLGPFSQVRHRLRGHLRDHALGLSDHSQASSKPPRWPPERVNTFRVLFFVLTFFTIGVVSNFKKLWEEGIGRLAAVYVLCLFGFIIWVGLLISWIFFHGVHPPLAG